MPSDDTEVMDFIRKVNKVKRNLQVLLKEAPGSYPVYGVKNAISNLEESAFKALQKLNKEGKLKKVPSF